jgi:hypothetical protein
MRVERLKIEKTIFLTISDANGKQWNFIQCNDGLEIAKRDFEDYDKLPEEEKDALIKFVNSELEKV